MQGATILGIHSKSLPQTVKYPYIYHLLLAQFYQQNPHEEPVVSFINSDGKVMGLGWNGCASLDLLYPGNGVGRKMDRSPLCSFQSQNHGPVLH